MAYVGTARIIGDQRTTLASVIQGEAGGQGLIGMQAVGGVIANRAASNFSGYGSDPVSQATARMQFQGQSPVSQISPQAYSVADQVLAGTNPDPTGGATYYANPGASSAAWARNLDGSNSVQIGAHYFTNNTQGIPFSGSGAVMNPQNSNDPLQYTGPSGFSTAGVPSNVETSAGSQITGFQQNADGSANVTLGFADGNGSGATPGGINASSFTQSDMSGGLGTPQTGSFGLGGLMAGASPVGLGNAGVGGTSAADAPSTASASSSAGGSMTVPQAIDTQTRGAASDTSSLNKQSQANTASLNKQSQANTKAVTDTANSIFKSISGDWSDYFVRIVFVIVGLIALAAGLMLFRPVQQTAVNIAGKIPA